MQIKDVAQALGGRLDGDGAIEVSRVVHPARAELPSDLALAMNADAVASLAGSKAQAVVVSTDHPVPAGSLPAVIAVSDVRIALAKLTAIFDPGPAHDGGIHPTAVIAPDAKLSEGVRVGAHAVIGALSRVGAGTTIMPHVTVGAAVRIGARGLLHCGARIGDRTIIGDRVIIHPNAVIGSDGFSFAPDLMSATAYTADVKVSRVHSLAMCRSAMTSKSALAPPSIELRSNRPASGAAQKSTITYTSGTMSLLATVVSYAEKLVFPAA